MLWRIYSILETFQTTSEFLILIFFILIIEKNNFQQYVVSTLTTNDLSLPKFLLLSEDTVIFIVSVCTFIRLRML